MISCLGQGLNKHITARQYPQLNRKMAIKRTLISPSTYNQNYKIHVPNLTSILAVIVQISKWSNSQL